MTMDMVGSQILVAKSQVRRSRTRKYPLKEKISTWNLTLHDNAFQKSRQSEEFSCSKTGRIHLQQTHTTESA